MAAERFSIRGSRAAFLAVVVLLAGVSAFTLYSELRTAHSAYRSGTSAWCGNCHGDYHDTVGTATFEHPNDELLPVDVVDQYNLYDGVLNPAGGNTLTAYLPEVPFEDGGA